MHRSKGHGWTMRAMIAALAVLVAATVMAGGDIKKMPADLRLHQSPDSPGKVTFNHASHVDTSKPDCTSCHPRLFSILQDRSKERTILHARMQKGAQCGACHNAKKAFGLDDCSTCHR